MEHQLLTQATQKEQPVKAPTSSPVQSSSAITLHPVLRLQRTVGNQAVQRLVNSGKLQAKLNVNQPGDVYEQEADQVAEQVTSDSASSSIQRRCACGGIAGPSGECEACAAKRKAIQRKETHPEPAAPAPSLATDVLNGSRGRPLDNATRSFMESRFEQDFSNVRVHTDGQAAESAQAINAKAYTVGHNVVFGAGQYEPGTSEGQKLLAHELTHVVQQSGDRQVHIQRALEPPESKTATQTPPPTPISSSSTQLAQQQAEHIEEVVEYIRTYLREHWRRNMSRPEMSIHGTVLAIQLVQKMHLSGKHIIRVFDKMDDESSEFLEAALFGGETVRALLNMKVGGFQRYRAKGEGFFAGVIRQESESQIEYTPNTRHFSAWEFPKVIGGFLVGVGEGIWSSITSNLSAIVDFFRPSFWKTIIKTLTEDIPEFLTNEEARFRAGQSLAQADIRDQRELATAEPYAYGEILGHMFGSALTEIVLTFLGLGWILKGIKALPVLGRVAKGLIEFGEKVAKTRIIQRGLKVADAISESINMLNRRFQRLLDRLPALTDAGRLRRAYNRLKDVEDDLQRAAEKVRSLEEAARAASNTEDAQRTVSDMNKAIDDYERKLAAYEREVGGTSEVGVGTGAGGQSVTTAGSETKGGTGKTTQAVEGGQQAAGKVRREVQVVDTATGEKHELKLFADGTLERCSDHCMVIVRNIRERSTVVRRSQNATAELRQEAERLTESAQKLAQESRRIAKLPEAERASEEALLLQEAADLEHEMAELESRVSKGGASREAVEPEIKPGAPSEPGKSPEVGTEKAMPMTKEEWDRLKPKEREALIKQYMKEHGIEQIRVSERHHAWPMYLGGPEEGPRISLDKYLHEAYHARLDKALPRRLKTEYYAKLSKAEKAKKIAILREVTLEFDARFGTEISKDLESALKGSLYE